MSKLPLFIHDLRHNWIEENIAWLERRPYPTNDLCVANSALRNGEIEGHAVPTDLFDRLDIDNNRFGINRKGWINMQDRLEEISKCPVALQQVTYLYIDVYVDEWLMDPGEKTIQLLADVLSAMPNLKRVRWGIPVKANKFFEKVFAQQGLQLPSITHLVVVSAFAQHMVSICPNLQSLEGGDYRHGSWDRENTPTKLLLQEVSRVPTIASLSFQSGWDRWNRQLVRDVLQAVPNLTNLSMLGEIKGHTRSDIRGAKYGVVSKNSPFSDEEMTPYLKDLVHELKSAPHLSHLRLPEAGNLDLDFDGGAWCGNAYMGADGREYGRQVSRQRTETIEEAAKIVFEVLPHLESLSVGSTSPVNIIRDEEGHVVEVKWAWTGRMHEYLYEIWPESNEEEFL